MLFEDDAVFVPGFKSELTKTIEGLPADWEILHLCTSRTFDCYTYMSQLAHKPRARWLRSWGAGRSGSSPSPRFLGVVYY